MIKSRQRSLPARDGFSVVGAAGSAFLVALAAAGCSADITRFDRPSFSLNGGETGSVRSPSEPVLGARETTFAQQSPEPGYSGGPGSYAPAAVSEPVRSAALTEPVSDDYASRYPAYEAPRAISRSDTGRSAPRPAAQTVDAPLEKGEMIVVESGDTLYGLSRQHGVSLAELMAVNGLTRSDLHPGQKLHLPAGASATRVPRAGSETIAASEAPADWTGSYTIAQGDSLFRIARSVGVRTEELQRYNGITDPRRIRPGLVLKVPAGRGDTSASSSRVAAIEPETRTDVSASPARGVRTVAITPPRVEAPSIAAPPSSPPRAAETPRAEPQQARLDPAEGQKLRWPARGRIIAGFGPRADGTHNDGINLAVPMGSDVHAAEDGVVAYAGSELRGYGNLILIRHDNGWVTAYAHNESMAVKRGDKVKRGDVIAKAGKSGQVDQPQVHFELRQGSKPVDPLPFLERL